MTSKRENILNLLEGRRPEWTPAAFFLHFDPAFHTGRAAVDKHLEFFSYTGMDFVKIQYEQKPPEAEPILQPRDWARARRVTGDYFEPTLQAVRGLVQAAGREALVVMTLYSPFMWLEHHANGNLAAHLKEDPQAVQQGLEIMTENVLALVRGCKQAGVDGFYASTQGGEAFRPWGVETFEEVIKPSDLAVWQEIVDLPFNILHICDYQGGYAGLSPYLDYPGQVVNCSLKLEDRQMSPVEVSRLFGRPFMGGLDRMGVLASGTPEQVRQAAGRVLVNGEAPSILAADCTVPAGTDWENLKAAVDAAHQGSHSIP